MRIEENMKDVMRKREPPFDNGISAGEDGCSDSSSSVGSSTL